MAITKLGNFNQNILNGLIYQFEASHSKAGSLSAKMRQWTPSGDLDPQDKLDLVSYCDPSVDTRGKARDLARQISMLVFGKVISKLD